MKKITISQKLNISTRAALMDRPKDYSSILISAEFSTDQDKLIKLFEQENPMFLLTFKDHYFDHYSPAARINTRYIQALDDTILITQSVPSVEVI